MIDLGFSVESESGSGTTKQLFDIAHVYSEDPYLVKYRSLYKLVKVVNDTC